MSYFELTEETKEHEGRTLFRVRSTKYNPVLYIPAGTLGGWVEKKSNLSDWGWVEDESLVADDAVVSNGSSVRGNSSVYNKSVVTDKSTIDSESTARGFSTVKESIVIEESTVIDAVVTGDSEIDKGSLVKGSVVANGSRIIDSLVDNACEVLDSYIYESDVIRAMVSDSDIRRTRIGDWSYITNSQINIDGDLLPPVNFVDALILSKRDVRVFTTEHNVVAVYRSRGDETEISVKGLPPQLGIPASDMSDILKDLLKGQK